jgi:hypothetical protein
VSEEAEHGRVGQRRVDECSDGLLEKPSVVGGFSFRENHERLTAETFITNERLREAIEFQPMTPRRDKRQLADDDPTAEEEGPSFDPTRTDQLGSPHGLARHASGVIERDDRGQARWVVLPPVRDADRTFDQLEARDNDDIAIEGESPAPDPKPTPQSGYNPYDTGPPQPQRKRR